MKNLMLSLGTLIISTAANAYVCQVDMIDNRGRIIDTFVAQTEYNGTCRDGLRDCNRELRTRGGYGARCVLRDYNGPGPGPGMNTYKVSVIVESKLMTLEGQNMSQIHSQCMQQVPFGSSDELTMTVNNAQTKRLTTGGWWSNSASICDIITNNIDLRSPNTRIPMDIYGSFENRQFNFRAYSKADALATCHNAYSTSGLGSSDELTIGVNNSGTRRVTTSGWWNTTSAVCAKFMEVLDQLVY